MPDSTDVEGMVVPTEVQMVCPQEVFFREFVTERLLKVGVPFRYYILDLCLSFNIGRRCHRVEESMEIDSLDTKGCKNKFLKSVLSTSFDASSVL